MRIYMCVYSGCVCAVNGHVFLFGTYIAQFFGACVCSLWSMMMEKEEEKLGHACGKAHCFL